jgi:hypothetical protein
MVAPGPQTRVDVLRRHGRRAGTAAYGLLVGGFTVVCAAQIIYQVWGPSEDPEAAADCWAGVERLVLAVRRARQAGEAQTGGERAAITRFREALRPEWDCRPSVGRACQGDGAALRALADADRFRYAEEHAIRYESLDLVRRRRRVKSLGRSTPTTSLCRPESTAGR